MPPSMVDGGPISCTKKSIWKLLGQKNQCWSLRERERKGQKKNLGQKLGKFKRNFYQGYHKEAHKPNCGRCKPTQNLNRIFISDYQKIKIKLFYKEWNKAGENVKTDLHGHNPLRAVWSINPNPGALSEEYQESQK